MRTDSRRFGIGLGSYKENKRHGLFLNILNGLVTVEFYNNWDLEPKSSMKFEIKNLRELYRNDPAGHLHDLKPEHFKV